MIKRKVCIGCNNVFEIKKSDRDYCNFYCKRKHLLELEHGKYSNCEFCGTQFKFRPNKRFCSKFCSTTNVSKDGNKAKKKTCIKCGETKNYFDFMRGENLGICQVCWSKDNPKWVEKQKRLIDNFVEIETLLKKIKSQGWRAYFNDSLMIVHYYAEIDAFGQKTSIDDMFIELGIWYMKEKRNIFR